MRFRFCRTKTRTLIYSKAEREPSDVQLVQSPPENDNTPKHIPEKRVFEFIYVYIYITYIYPLAQSLCNFRNAMAGMMFKYLIDGVGVVCKGVFVLARRHFQGSLALSPARSFVQQMRGR